jgi:hypothetical protein
LPASIWEMMPMLRIWERGGRFIRPHAETVSIEELPISVTGGETLASR